MHKYIPSIGHDSVLNFIVSYSICLKICEKRPSKIDVIDQPTNQPANQPTERHSSLYSSVHATKNTAVRPLITQSLPWPIEIKIIESMCYAWVKRLHWGPRSNSLIFLTSISIWILFKVDPTSPLSAIGCFWTLPPLPFFARKLRGKWLLEEGQSGKKWVSWVRRFPEGHQVKLGFALGKTS